MPRFRFDLKTAKRNSIAKTNAIVIGGTYFLSSFYDKDGAMVKVLAKSTATNSAGWPSSVTVQVIAPLGGEAERANLFYAAGAVHSVNASNLYLNRTRRRQRSLKMYTSIGFANIIEIGEPL